MASGPNTPGRPVSTRASTESEAVAEIVLVTPLRRVNGQAMDTIRFTRAPAMGELKGWLKPTSPDDFEAALQRLLVDPEWVEFVLSRCAGVSKSEFDRMSFVDYAACIPVIADFIAGSPSTGASD